MSVGCVLIYIENKKAPCEIAKCTMVCKIGFNKIQAQILKVFGRGFGGNLFAKKVSPEISPLLSPHRFKVGGGVLAEWAGKAIGQDFTVIVISAYLTHPTDYFLFGGGGCVCFIDLSFIFGNATFRH